MQGMVLTLELRAFGKIHLGGNFTFFFNNKREQEGERVRESPRSLIKVSGEIIITLYFSRDKMACGYNVILELGLFALSQGVLQNCQ